MKILMKKCLTIFAILLTFTMIGCNGQNSGNTGSGADIVATVNGEEVSRQDFSAAFEQELNQLQMQGIDFNSPEMEEAIRELELFVLDNYFVIPMLVAQKAVEEGIEVSEAEIEERFQQFADSYGGEELLLQQMAEINFTREDIDRDIRQELLINSYLDSYIDHYYSENPGAVIDQESIDIDFVEVEEYYTMIVEEYTELSAMLEDEESAMPNEQIEAYLMQLEEQYGDLTDPDGLEEAREVIEGELRQFKAAQQEEQLLQQILADHIAELQENSLVEIFL